VSCCSRKIDDWREAVWHEIGMTWRPERPCELSECQRSRCWHPYCVVGFAPRGDRCGLVISMRRAQDWHGGMRLH